MKKTAKVFLVIFLLLINMQVAEAGLGENETVGHVVVGAGLQWALDSLRIGRDDIEIGKLNFYSLGIEKLVRYDTVFVGFGLAFTSIANNSITAGPLASMGYEPNLLSWFNVRFEANGVAFATGKTWGELLVCGVAGF